MTAGQPVPDAITTYFDAINTEDWDRLAEVWHEEADLLAVGARPRHGRDDIVSYYPKTLAPWKAHLDNPTRYIVSGDTVTAEIHFSGRSADGVSVEFDAVDVFDLVDGRIQRLTNWYDVAAVRSLLPPPVPSVVGQYFACLNEEDWEGFAALWADDAVVLAAGARPRQGVDDLMMLYTKMFDHWPKHRDVPGRTLIDGTTITVEVHFIGSVADGREFEFDAVDVIDVQGGKITRLTNWYDTAKVRAMIAPSTSEGPR
ncbi:MAG: nuclear transport factor 2 family protein [Nostocoides sp.]